MDKKDLLFQDKNEEDETAGEFLWENPLIFLILNVFFIITVTGSFFLLKYGAKIHFDRF